MRPEGQSARNVDATPHDPRQSAAQAAVPESLPMVSRKAKSKLDVVCATREIGPYSFEFILRDGKRYVQLWEDHDTMLWESSPFGEKDDRTMRRRILVGLTVMASRLSVLHEKTLMKIHEIAK